MHNYRRMITPGTVCSYMQLYTMPVLGLHKYHAICNNRHMGSIYSDNYPAFHEFAHLFIHIFIHKFIHLFICCFLFILCIYDSINASILVMCLLNQHHLKCKFTVNTFLGIQLSIFTTHHN